MDRTVAAIPAASLNAGITTEMPGGRQFRGTRCGFIRRRCLRAKIMSARIRRISIALAATRQAASTAMV